MEESTLTILVVDDEPDLADNLKLPLEVEGYRVLVAHNGLEALTLLEQEPVNLILSDIAMPNMNGYQLYERVCETPAWAIIPFVFLTARSMDSDIRYGKELGVDDYLAKPIRTNDLLAIVRGKLRRAKHVADSMAQVLGSSLQGRGENAARFVEVGLLRVDSEQHRVWVKEAEVKLSAKEFVLLEYLARQNGKIASPQELIKVTHDYDTDHIEAGALLRPLILSTRRKLGSTVGDMGLIENVRGVGYRLVTPDD